jgi:hypothetical protein
MHSYVTLHLASCCRVTYQKRLNTSTVKQLQSLLPGTRNSCNSDKPVKHIRPSSISQYSPEAAAHSSAAAVQQPAGTASCSNCHHMLSSR